MKILFIVPGSGEKFYCGNCLRDNLQAAALRKAGHDVVIMPLYLPFHHRIYQSDAPLFFPATSFYLSQKFFRKTAMPSWLKRVSGSDMMLNMAASLSGTTSAKGMEGMTLAMITGDDPAFRSEMQQLIDWIKGNDKPDIIQLSSSLLLGIAKTIREQTDIPVICSLQDEEVWIDSMKKKEAQLAWEVIRENNGCIARFITTSRYYRDAVIRRYPELKDTVEVVYPGVDASRYDPADEPAMPVIGFFNRMNRASGLDILAEAFVKLKEKNSLPGLRLKIGGGHTGLDNACIAKVKQMLSPWKEEVDWEEEYDPDKHPAFFKAITVLSVPITFDESTGLYLCESFAAAKPVVEPSSGSFREIVGEGGLIYEPNDSEHLAEALEQILSDRTLYARCREQAVELSKTRYNDKVQAAELCRIYSDVLERKDHKEEASIN